jgi:thiol:disulfide interchange protein DsbC
MEPFMSTRGKIRITVGCFLAITALSRGPLVSADDYDELSASMKALAPGASNVTISETPIDGLLEVQIDAEIVYTNPTGKILVQGRMFDLETRTDLTEQAKSRLRIPKIAEIDRSEQIVFESEHPEHELIVFTDIDCGYCRRLHSQVKEYNDVGISIRYMLFPRGGIASHSYEKAVAVWCADDQRAALTTAKLGTEPNALQCENPVKSQYELGNLLGVTGTPALLTSDGNLIPGYVPPADLKKRLDSMAALAKD